MKELHSFKQGWQKARGVGGKALKGAFAVEIANNLRQGDVASAAENAAWLAPGKVAKAAGRIATVSRAATGIGAAFYPTELGRAERPMPSWKPAPLKRKK